jgi:uncharacterized protein with HEPN domain
MSLPKPKSNMLPEKDLIRLRHMRDYAQEAVAFIQGETAAEFLADRKLQLAVTHLLELVGEAANHVSPETQSQCPQIPWPQVIAMRHRLIHGYDFLDYMIIGQTVRQDLPKLFTQLEAIISKNN